MMYEYKDKLGFLVEEFEYPRYVCFSKYLPKIHPEYIIVVDTDEVETIAELEENIYPEERIIIKQGVNTDSEMIYKIYLKKVGKLQKNQYSEETIDFIAEMMIAHDDNSINDDLEDEEDEMDGYVK